MPEDHLTPTCNCPRTDGYVIPRQGCDRHPRPLAWRLMTRHVAPEPQRSDEQIDADCAWADYRKDYGVPREHLVAAHKAFMAGWQAAREGDQSVVR